MGNENCLARMYVDTLRHSLLWPICPRGPRELIRVARHIASRSGVLVLEPCSGQASVLLVADQLYIFEVGLYFLCKVDAWRLGRLGWIGSRVIHRRQAVTSPYSPPARLGPQHQHQSQSPTGSTTAEEDDLQRASCAEGLVEHLVRGPRPAKDGVGAVQRLATVQLAAITSSSLSVAISVAIDGSGSGSGSWERLQVGGVFEVLALGRVNLGVVVPVGLEGCPVDCHWAMAVQMSLRESYGRRNHVWSRGTAAVDGGGLQWLLRAVRCGAGARGGGGRD